MATHELIQTYQVENCFTWDISKIKYENDFEIIVKERWVNIFGGADEMSRFLEKALIHYLLSGHSNKKIMNSYYCTKYIENPDKYLY